MALQIGVNLASLRILKGGVTPYEVAKESGIDLDTIIAFEAGSSKSIDFSTLEKLCKYFQCSPNEVLIIKECERTHPYFDASSATAEEIVVEGLRRAMNSEPQSSEEIWAEFDSLREKIQNQARESEPQKGQNYRSA